MPHQNEHLQNAINAELAVPVADSWIFCTLPFHHLPQPGDRICLQDDFILIVDRLEHIFHQRKPPYITIACKRITIEDRDTYINFLNQFGFSFVSAYNKHVE